jgi:hypothetical protein
MTSCQNARSALYVFVSMWFALLFTSSPALAAPYTFTSQDFIEYGIYFSPGGRHTRAVKLLTVRFGDIDAYYNKFFPDVNPKHIPGQAQTLRLRTPRGSVIVNRNDNVGLSVTRDTWNEKKRTGTKRLDVSFQNATCTDAAGVASPCAADLVLTTEGPDKGVVRPRRVLTITTSTGLSFTYRTRLRDGGKPFTPADFRAPVVNNYAWEWRPAYEE